MDQDIRGERGYNVSIWVPILLVPILLIAGWAANDVFESSMGTDTEFGVGGAPGDGSTTPEPTSSFFDEEPTVTATPTPSATPTPTVTILEGVRGVLDVDESPTPTDTQGDY